VSGCDSVIVNTSMVGVVAVSFVELAVLIRTYYMTNTYYYLFIYLFI
jgi:hypothetical protein